jgi:PD-(D/E)XK endonuclease
MWKIFRRGLEEDGYKEDCGYKEDGENHKPEPGYVDWIYASAADAEPSWWEREGTNPKRMGELSQAAFLAKAQTLGFGLAVPWGDSEKCDFICWARPEGRLLRVQVKATGRLNCGGYDVQPVYSTRGEGKKTYTARDIDVLAAHVRVQGRWRRQKEIWYLLPIAAFEGVKSLRFYPGRKNRKARWEGYREGWEWLRGNGQ